MDVCVNMNRKEDVMKLVEKVRLCEVGLRDGLQNEKRILETKDKLELLDLVGQSGFKIIEPGSFVSPKNVPQMADTDELYKKGKLYDGVEYRALVANLKGVQRGIDCGCKKVKLNVSASRTHNLANLNMTPEQSVAGFRDCVDLAHKNNIEISGSISMPFGSPWDKTIPIEDVKSIVEAYLNVGIDEISLSDAAGVAYPTQVYEMAIKMRADYPKVRWVLHFHNTRGLGIANIIAGMQAGFDTFDTSFAGLGGCPFVPGAAGNVSTEDVVHLMDQMGVYTGIDIDKVIGIGKKVRDLTGNQNGSYILNAGKASDLVRELPTGQKKYTK